MLGAVQCDVQQQSRLLCGSISQQSHAFQEKLGSRNILLLQSAPCLGSPVFSGPCSGSPQLLQPLSPTPRYKHSGWPCLELVRTWASRFFGEVPPCIVVQSLLGSSSVKLSLQEKRSKWYCRGVPSSFPWKETVIPCPFLPPGFTLLFGLLNKANGYKFYFLTYLWYFYV